MLGCAYYIWVRYYCTIYIMVTLEIEMVPTEYYYSLILIVWFVKLKQKMSKRF